jgi:hypothetical protein
VAGVRWGRRVGLEGAEAAKRGWRNEFREPFERDSQSTFRFELLHVGEERGGVTGALLHILRGGRFVGMEAMFRRKGRRYVEEFPSKQVGLGNEEDEGLAW